MAALVQTFRDEGGLRPDLPRANVATEWDLETFWAYDGDGNLVEERPVSDEEFAAAFQRWEEAVESLGASDDVLTPTVRVAVAHLNGVIGAMKVIKDRPVTATEAVAMVPVLAQALYEVAKISRIDILQRRLPSDMPLPPVEPTVPLTPPMVAPVEPEPEPEAPSEVSPAPADAPASETEPTQVPETPPSPDAPSVPDVTQEAPQ